MMLPLHRFSNRDRRPIRVEGWEHGLGVNGGSCSGTLWLAPADFALCKHWMGDVGATLTWEAFEKHCEHRKAISKASACLCREMQLMQICWCHGERGPNQLRSHTAFERIWRELCAGGVVVCWCVHGQHGSPASLVAFFVSWLGISVPRAQGILEQHGCCNLARYKLDRLPVHRHVQVFVARVAPQTDVAVEEPGVNEVPASTAKAAPNPEAVEEPAAVAEVAAKPAAVQVTAAAAEATAKPQGPACAAPRTRGHPIVPGTNIDIMTAMRMHQMELRDETIGTA